jgi:hypothetical protein
MQNHHSEEKKITRAKGEKNLSTHLSIYVGLYQSKKVCSTNTIQENKNKSNKCELKNEGQVYKTGPVRGWTLQRKERMNAGDKGGKYS